MRLKFCAAGEEGSGAMGTHTLAFLMLTGRDEIGLERGPNKDMLVVVCVQPKEHPRIEEAKKKSRGSFLVFFCFPIKKRADPCCSASQGASASTAEKCTLQRCDAS